MVMGSPSRNYPYRFVALREHDKESLAIHISYRLATFLAIVTPPV
jgi:hypothetical protein